jgi:hypothetical protein
MKNRINLFLFCVVYVLANTVGCSNLFGTHVIIPPTDRNVLHVSDTKYPLSVYAPPDDILCAYKFQHAKAGARSTIEIGTAVCENEKLVLSSFFEKSKYHENLPQNEVNLYDLVMKSKIVDASLVIKFGLPARMEAIVIYEFSIENSQGDIIMVRNIQVLGVPHSFSTAEGMYKQAMREAIDSLFLEFSQSIQNSFELRKLVESKS